MKAAVFKAFGAPLEICEVPDPHPGPCSAVLEVQANGICRSDWHGWMGHDPAITLPHVPGHEMTGTVVEVGSDVRDFAVGDRVTVPFSCGCGACRYCQQGQLHICDNEFQPGFTHWGAFAQYVEIHYADHNLVRLPDSLATLSRGPLGATPSSNLLAVDRAHILSVLEDCGWKIKGNDNAAERLGLKPSTLRYRMKKLGIRRPDRQPR